MLRYKTPQSNSIDVITSSPEESLRNSLDDLYGRPLANKIKLELNTMDFGEELLNLIELGAVTVTEDSEGKLCYRV